MPLIEIGGQQIGIDRACGLTWNSADTMPRLLCEDLEIAPGSTFAQGAGALKARIKHAEAERTPTAF
jgi:hypothetical protein